MRFRRPTRNILGLVLLFVLAGFWSVVEGAGLGGLAIGLSLAIGLLVWGSVERRSWDGFKPEPGWTFEPVGLRRSVPDLSRFDAKGGDVRHVLRGGLDGWPLVAREQWFEETGWEWRCALDVGIRLPQWYVWPQGLMANARMCPFPDCYDYSPDLHPGLAKIMSTDLKPSNWSTSGTWVITSERVMTPWKLDDWLNGPGERLAEVAAILRTELSTRQLQLAPTATNGVEWTPTPSWDQPAFDETPAPAAVSDPVRPRSQQG